MRGRGRVDDLKTASERAVCGRGGVVGRFDQKLHALPAQASRTEITSTSSRGGRHRHAWTRSHAPRADHERRAPHRARRAPHEIRMEPRRGHGATCGESSPDRGVGGQLKGGRRAGPTPSAPTKMKGSSPGGDKSNFKPLLAAHRQGRSARQAQLRGVERTVGLRLQATVTAPRTFAASPERSGASRGSAHPATAAPARRGTDQAIGAAARSRQRRR